MRGAARPSRRPSIPAERVYVAAGPSGLRYRWKDYDGGAVGDDPGCGPRVSVVLALLLALGLGMGCSEDTGSPTQPVFPTWDDESVQGDSSSADTTSAADSTEAHIRAELDMNEDSMAIVGDSVYKDDEIVGYVVVLNDSTGNNNPVPPGYCLEWVYYIWVNGVKVIYRTEIVYCNTGDGGGGGGTTDTTQVSITLTCPADVDRGDNVSCEIESSETLTNVRWTFSSSSTSGNSETGTTWGGMAVESGTLTITGNSGGEAFDPIEHTITVNSRGWVWTIDVGWGINCDYAWGQEWARVTSMKCASNYFFNMSSGNYTKGTGTGPWAGTYYVKEKNAPLRACATMRPAMRSDGPNHLLTQALSAQCGGATSANEYKVNASNCANETGYTSARSFLDVHEGRHLSDLTGLAGGSHDLYKKWDEIVATSDKDLDTQVIVAANGTQNHINHQGAALDASDPWPGFTFWLYKSGWSLANHNYPT